LLLHNGVRLLYDRGTLLVVEPPAALHPTRVPGLRWDPRVRAHRAPARCYASITAALVRQRIPFTDAVRYPGHRPGPWSAIELRPYQDAALHTRVACAAMARTALTTLCLVPTRVLLHQWLRTVRSVYPHAIGCLGNGRRELAAVTVATFDSAYRSMEEDEEAIARAEPPC
jgi:hypothetical protein